MVSPLSNACSRFARRFSMSGIKHGAATLTLGVASLTLAMTPLLLLVWLMQPKVLANPGISALRIAQAASWEPFVQESLQSAELSHRESPASLAQDGPQYRQPKTSAEPRPSKREASRRAQLRKTMKRAHGFAQYSRGYQHWSDRGRAGSYRSPVSPLAAHRRQTQPDSFVVAQSWQDDFNSRRDEISR